MAGSIYHPKDAIPLPLESFSVQSSHRASSPMPDQVDGYDSSYQIPASDVQLIRYSYEEA